MEGRQISFLSVFFDLKVLSAKLRDVDMVHTGNSVHIIHTVLHMTKPVKIHILFGFCHEMSYNIFIKEKQREDNDDEENSQSCCCEGSSRSADGNEDGVVQVKYIDPWGNMTAIQQW